MQIIINHPNNRKETLTITETSISSLFALIQASVNIKAAQFKATFSGKLLDKTSSFNTNDLGIKNGSTIDVTLKCLGGDLNETDRQALLERNNKTVCRVCYATNSVRATNCRKKSKCGRSTKLRPKKQKKKAKK
ncbi:hypothetical protein EDEG_03419 [Edhazardia aedis USNM 41457]|uniref:Ubiquitin-like domain-containing protein n=1 Tax=Edhazardia aedis (strain USNM 41457) TaxID=1003232 RepID=J8ZR28_EDHAE|nr:hypothetical protein EDEG_03419 [Edhazardia aedis USNM 41457]|eukprot:EJW02138.1 hypothetical protein EDEG_03419 [Edhazardia aedis USNM 41457]